ncbi:MAG: response regulator [Planctomycetes bacterium]|nr:response regulator [Planctomycetota bacterium]
MTTPKKWKRGITQRIVRQFAAIILSTVVLVMVALSILMSVSYEKEAQRHLASETYYAYEMIENRLEYLCEHLGIMANNPFILNSLIDPEGRSDYLKQILREYASLNDVVSVALVDSQGEMIFHSLNENIDYKIFPQIYTLLTTGERQSFSDNNGKTYMGLACEYYNSPQGAIIIELNMQNICADALMHDREIDYKVWQGDEVIINTFDDSLEYIQSDLGNQVLQPIIVELNLKVLLGNVQAVVYEPLRNALGRLLLVSVFVVAIGISVSVMIGHRLARPVVELSQKVKALNVGKESTIAPLGTKDELEDVAVAFNEKQAEIIKKITLEKDLTLAQTKIELSQQRSEELLKLNQELYKADRAKSQFLANMSHEIRTPMNAVLGMTELLKDSPLNDTQRHSIATIMSSGKSLMVILNDILDYSKIEMGKLNLDNHPFDLIKCVDESISLHSLSIKEKGLDLIVDIPDSTPKYLLGDVVRLKQVLNNLVSNAIKFTERGYIKIAVSLKEEHEENSELLFYVEDSGIGIADEHQEKLFRSFEQVDGSITRKYGGTGLGLAISNRLVGLMGGEITIDSQLDEGSAFSFNAFLVRADDEQVQELLQQEEDDKKAATLFKVDDAELKKRILLVDDKVANQEVACAMLNRIGLEADLANNGQEAIDLMEQHHYDLVLMDCQMPVMDGFSATEMIRDPDSKLRNHQVPIVAMTANVLNDYQDRCVQVGMNDFLPKPVTISKLNNILEKWLLGNENASSPKHDRSSGDEPEAEEDVKLVRDDCIFDRTGFLSRIGGDENYIAPIMDGFMEDMADSLSEANNCFAESLWERLSLAAHAIKGTAANVGALRLSAKAKILEEKAQRNDSEENKLLLAEIEEELKLFRENVL